MLFAPGCKAFKQRQASWGTTRPAAARGTSITPSIGSKSAWTSLIAAVSLDSWGLWVCFNSNFTSGANRHTIVDLGIDESGGTSYRLLCYDLLCGGANTYAVGPVWYFFPIFVPAGSRIGVRAQSSVTTAFRVGIMLDQGPERQETLWAGRFATAIGLSGITGTAITLGTTNKGAWVSLGTTSFPCRYWELGAHVAVADISWNATAVHVDLATGDGSTKEILLQDVLFQQTTTEALSKPVLHGPSCERYLPAGVTLYARGQSSGTVDNFEVAAYGVGA